MAAPAPRIAANGVEWLPVPGWEKLPWLWHGFSTRKGGGSRAYCPDGAAGELNLGFTAEDSREAVTCNRSLLAEAVTGDAETPLLTLRQIHSNLLVVVKDAPEKGRTSCESPEEPPSVAEAGIHFAGLAARQKSRPDTKPAYSAACKAAGAVRKRPWKGGVPTDGSFSLGCKADGFMTAEPGLLLGIQTADCIPVLVADRKQRAVAAFHAGWRGTVRRIVETGVGRMRLEFGSRAEDLVAAIGPGIGACCYAVGEEVFSSFESQFSYARELFREVYDADPVRTKYPMLFLTQRAPGHSPIGPSLHLDLVEANRRQLLDAGLKPRAVKVVGGCTSCQPELFFSHRASRGHAGRLLSVIGIRPRQT